MGWFEDMTPDATLTAEVRGFVVGAMLAFSDHQRRVMIRAGVRFWSPQALPPEFSSLGPGNTLHYTTAGAARYFAPLRLVHLFGTVSLRNVRHELGHCWDHVRRGNVPSLRGLTGQSLFDAISRPAQMTLSSTDRVEVCLDAYRRRISRVIQQRRLRPGCRPQTPTMPDADFFKVGGWGYSSHDAREFYAEFYRVFHAPTSEAGAAAGHARIWLYAREMYNLLLRESRSEQSPVPDPTAIQEAIQLECLPDPPP